MYLILHKYIYQLLNTHNTTFAYFDTRWRCIKVAEYYLYPPSSSLNMGRPKESSRPALSREVGRMYGVQAVGLPSPSHLLLRDRGPARQWPLRPLR